MTRVWCSQTDSKPRLWTVTVRVGDVLEHLTPQGFLNRVDEWVDDSDPYLTRSILERLAVLHGAQLKERVNG